MTFSKMKKSLKANAKINIGLNILERLPNGYHSLDMIMAPIDLSDELEIEYTGKEGDLIITTNKKDIPTDERNILWKVYDAFYRHAGLKREEVRVHLIKNIPHEAGLGGGSSDGGCFLREINSHHGGILSVEELIDLSKGIGADIPFFLLNETSRAKGIGERLQRIENNLEVNLILIKPKFGVSAGEAYSNFSKISNPKYADIEKISKGLKENELENVINNIENHLEQGLLLTNEEILNFRRELDDLTHMKFFMSGSGSTYFSMVKRELAQKTYDTLKALFKDYEVYLCKFL